MFWCHSFLLGRVAWCKNNAIKRMISLTEELTTFTINQKLALKYHFSITNFKLQDDRFKVHDAPRGLGISQPTSALTCACHKKPLTRDMNCLLVCSEAYEFGQFGTGWSWFRSYTVLKANEWGISLRGDHELHAAVLSRSSWTHSLFAYALISFLP